MNKKLIDDFCAIYQNLNKHNLNELTKVYSDDIIFIDPIHQINGLDELTKYFANLYENMEQCHFHIDDVIESDGQACLIWRMQYQHSKVNNGRLISVDGTSHLQFSDKITRHRDYLDLGQMLYEQLPVLGSVIKAIKKRASQ